MKKPSDSYTGKKVAVLGFGIEGQSVSRWMLGQGADVTVLDEKKSEADVAMVLEDLLKDHPIHFIQGPFERLDTYDAIVVSPGIKMDRPEIVKARDAGVEVTTGTNLFMDLVPCRTIGVTGTKGKGTTSSLITEMLKNAGFDAYLGGNIGTAPLDFLHTLTPESLVVLELSSFQIMNMTKSPYVAVFLMVTSEHLDYHKDTAEYVAAKGNIMSHQGKDDYVISTIDYPNSEKLFMSAQARRIPVSTRTMLQDGVFVWGESIVNARNGRWEEVAKTADVFIPGKHNWENVVAAIAAVKRFNVGNDVIQKTLREFRGLPHRIELVRELDGVRYFDDSFSTTPETAVAAIRAFEGPKIVILGGSSKNSDFTELGETISVSTTIRAIIGIGVEWSRIKEKIKVQSSNAKSSSKFKCQIIEGCATMKEIVEAARKAAFPGDVVLLSPGCASFGMFRNYKDRGDQFKQCVHELK